MPTFKPSKPSDADPALPPGVRPYLSAEDRAARRKLEEIGYVVDRVMTGIGRGRAAPAIALSTRWNEVVGAEFATKTAPGSCEAGRLVILAKDGSTASKLRFNTSQILQNAAEIVGKGTISSISFRVSPSLSKKSTT